MAYVEVFSALLLVASAAGAVADSSQQQFEAKALSRKSVADRDAGDAAAQGNFGLVWASSLGGRQAIGVRCRFLPYNADTGMVALTTAEVGISDVPGADDPVRQHRLFTYAEAYNQALIAHPAFPYADLCRSDGADPLSKPELDKPASLVLAPAVETPTPYNIGEAARRGTMDAVLRLLSRTSKSDLNQLDDFGLTPLAWAVIGQRDEVANALLAHGADPLAPSPRSLAAPLRLALLYGQHALAGRMITEDVAGRVRPWPSSLIDAAVLGKNVDLTRRMLVEEHQGTWMPNLLSAASATGEEALLSTIIDAGKVSGTDIAQAAVMRKDPVLLSRAFTMRPNLLPKAADRHSLLGQAIEGGGAMTDQLTALLLDYGIPPDSPADWGRNGYEEGSPVPTALVTLVALANRSTPDVRTDASWTQTASAQRRTLDILLAHGASLRAIGSDRRPLAVYLATGQYDPRGMITREEISPDWIERLAGEGMDVNATWLESTALDWLDAMGMRGSRTARTFEQLGGRRIRVAPIKR